MTIISEKIRALAVVVGLLPDACVNLAQLQEQHMEQVVLHGWHDGDSDLLNAFAAEEGVDLSAMDHDNDNEPQPRKLYTVENTL